MQQNHTTTAADGKHLNPQLYNSVRSEMIAQGTSFAAWCREKSICRQYASACLQFKTNGRKAKKLRLKIARAAGVSFP